MTKRKWILTTSSILLVLLLLAGYMAIAAEYGAETDPLVSPSYITDVLAPETIEKVNETIDQKTLQFQTQLNQTLAEYTEKMDETLNNFESRNDDLANNDDFINAVANRVTAMLKDDTSSSASAEPATVAATGTVWKMVEIQKGQTLVFEVGGMILPRIGSATCFTPGNPGLINVTTATELSSGGALATNNLYIVTVAGRGFTATGDTNKFIISGTYTIK